MLSLIHYFRGCIDDNSILNIMAALDGKIRDYTIIYNDDNAQSDNFLGVTRHKVDHRSSNKAINHLIENTPTDDILIIRDSISVMPESMIQFISHVTENNIEFGCGVTGYRDGFYGIDYNLKPMSRLAFNQSLRIISQDNNHLISVLNPMLFYAKKRYFRSVGGLDEHLSCSTESIIGFSIDAVRRGFSLYQLDLCIANCESKSSSTDNLDRQLLLKKYEIEETPQLELNDIQMKLRKRDEEHLLLPMSEYLSSHCPHIIRDKKFRNRFSGKNILILYPGISIDDFRPFNIYSFDYVIGIDFVGRIHKCDFVFTQELHILSDLLTVYGKEDVITTDYIFDRMQNKYVLLRDITDKAHILDTTSNTEDLEPHSPYLMHSDPLVCITHFMVSSRAKMVQIMGADFKWLHGRSHVKNQYYNNGFVTQADVATIEENRNTLRLLEVLSKIADKYNVKLMRNYYV